MTSLICKYCHATEPTALSFAHHVCDPNTLRDRIAGQEAHMRMWHTEAMRLAKKYNEDTFYHPVSPKTAPPAHVSPGTLPTPSAEVRELAAEAVDEHKHGWKLMAQHTDALATVAAWALAELAAREAAPDTSQMPEQCRILGY